MDCRSLMVGDLVVYKDRFIKVENIYRDSINYYPDIPYVQEEDYIEEKDIVPISLTPEILKKNGWKHCDFGWYHKDVDFLVILSNGRTKGVSVTDGNKVVFWVDYVHELQRALRCCDLWDLANNFKIDKTDIIKNINN